MIGSKSSAAATRGGVDTSDLFELQRLERLLASHFKGAQTDMPPAVRVVFDPGGAVTAMEACSPSYPPRSGDRGRTRTTARAGPDQRQPVDRGT